MLILITKYVLVQNFGSTFMMTSNSDLLKSREQFLQENPQFTEVELTDESKAIGKLDEIDLLENEIWLLQCPKNMDMTELQNQKLKIPGRSNNNSCEAVSMEFDKGKERHVFGYCNRKGQYVMRILPVRGTIVVRDRLKTAETITKERAEEWFPPTKRIPMPKTSVRHPLLGISYEDKVKVDKYIEKRLQKADENAAQILKETLQQKNEQKLGMGYEKTREKGSVRANSVDDDSVEFVSEEKPKKKKRKNKRKQIESDKETQNVDEAHHIKKCELKERDFVSKDLQWLQSI